VSTVIVAVVVGLLSGLAGSVLGPIVTYLLGRRERKEQREREIHRELREMLLERRQEGSQACGDAFRVWAELKLGKAPAVIMSEYGKRRAERSHPSGHSWEPYRIEDGALRRLAEVLNVAINDLHTSLSLAFSVADADEFQAQVFPKATRVEELVRAVRIRLDELGW
jgi:hypothetical protein